MPLFFALFRYLLTIFTIIRHESDTIIWHAIRESFYFPILKKIAPGRFPLRALPEAQYFFIL